MATSIVTVNSKQLTVVIGLGFVGLTLALTLAKKINVVGVDLNPQILNFLREAKPTFHEPGLEGLLATAVESKRFTVTSKVPQEPVRAVIITVGTPMGATSQDILSGVYKAAEDALACIGPDTLVILRSTVHVGTTSKLRNSLERALGFPPNIVFAPERTVEGKALIELLSLPQIIGADDESSWEKARGLFEEMGVSKIVRTRGTAEAEFSKLIGNAFRDTFFGFANEVAVMASAFGLDAHDAIQAANFEYPRNRIAAPGITAGPCLEKDSLFLLDHTASESSILGAARQINLNAPVRFLNEVLQQNFGLADKASSKLRGLIIGLAFKGAPPTSDTRGSFAPRLASWMRNASGYSFDYIHGFDPLVQIDPKELSLDAMLDEVSPGDYDIVLIQHKGDSVLRSLNSVRAMLGREKPIIVDFWNTFDGSQEHKNLFVFGKPLKRNLT